VRHSALGRELGIFLKLDRISDLKRNPTICKKIMMKKFYIERFRRGKENLKVR